MKLNTYTAALAGLFACIVTACDRKPENLPAPPAPPTLTKFGIDIALAENYGFMSAMMVNGDGKNFVMFYSDTATLKRVGSPPIHGRDSLAAFARNGKEWGLRDIVRTSLGHTFADSIISDSGTFVAHSDTPLRAHTFPQQGRYWTRWRVRGLRDWLIVSDSLQGERPAPQRGGAR